MKNKIGTEKIGNIYLFLIFGIFPLFFHNFYYDIYQTKYYFFVITTILMAFVAVLFCDVDFGQLFSKMKKEGMIWYISFLLFAGISAMLSSHGKEAFTGSAGRYNGFLIYAVYAVAFLILFQTKEITTELFVVLEISGILAGILGILNHYSIDPFGFTKGLDITPNFMSTLGNTGCFVEFMVMIAAVSGTLYVKEKKTVHSIWHIAVYCISCAALILAGPEAAYIGLFVFLIVVVFAVEKRGERFRFWALIICPDIILLLLCLVKRINPKFAQHQKYIGSVTVYLLSHVRLLLLSLLVMCGIVMMLWIFTFKLHAREQKNRKKIYLMILVCLAVMFSVIFFSVNMGWINGFSALKIDDDWGTSRGYIWRIAGEYYSSLPVWQKLIGIGPDTMYFAFESMNARVAETAIDNAHNLVLQMLITHGIFGLASYLGFVISSIRICVKKASENKMYYILLTSVISFYAAAMPGVNMISSSAVAMLLLGLIRCSFSGEELSIGKGRKMSAITLIMIAFLLLLFAFKIVLQVDGTAMMNEMLAG